MRELFTTLRCLALAGMWAAALGNAAAADSPIRPVTWAVKLERPGLANFHQVSTNLYRGAQPTARGMAELKAMGIKTVVNLRTLHSDRDELVGIDLKQARLHMKPWRVDEDDVVQFLKIMGDTNNLPVFVHCQRGADRTGLQCAMYRIALCGWTREEAIREMREGGFNFYPGWKDIVTYLEKVNIEKLKQRLQDLPPAASRPPGVVEIKKDGDRNRRPL